MIWNKKKNEEKENSLNQTFGWQIILADETVPFVRQLIGFELNEPHHKKTCLSGLRPGKTQTGPLSYRSELESWNYKYRNKRYYTVQAANNKGADQTARMRRLICTFVVRIWLKQVFSWSGSINRCHFTNQRKKAALNFFVLFCGGITGIN